MGFCFGRTEQATRLDVVQQDADGKIVETALKAIDLNADPTTGAIGSLRIPI